MGYLLFFTQQYSSICYLNRLCCCTAAACTWGMRYIHIICVRIIQHDRGNSNSSTTKPGARRTLVGRRRYEAAAAEVTANCCHTFVFFMYFTKYFHLLIVTKRSIPWALAPSGLRKNVRVYYSSGTGIIIYRFASRQQYIC